MLAMNEHGSVILLHFQPLRRLSSGLSYIITFRNTMIGHHSALISHAFGTWIATNCHQAPQILQTWVFAGRFVPLSKVSISCHAVFTDAYRFLWHCRSRARVQQGLPLGQTARHQAQAAPSSPVCCLVSSQHHASRLG